MDRLRQVMMGYFLPLLPLTMSWQQSVIQFWALQSKNCLFNILALAPRRSVKFCGFWDECISTLKSPSKSDMLSLKSFTGWLTLLVARIKEKRFIAMHRLTAVPCGHVWLLVLPIDHPSDCALSRCHVYPGTLRSDALRYWEDSQEHIRYFISAVSLIAHTSDDTLRYVQTHLQLLWCTQVISGTFKYLLLSTISLIAQSADAILGSTTNAPPSVEKIAPRS